MSEEMTQEDPSIRLDRQDAVAVITMNRASGQHALNEAVIAGLSRAFPELRDDAEVRVVILTGAGQVFSVGVEDDELQAMAPGQAESFARAGQTLADLIENLGKPVIAAVNGPARGSGCGLALACTWRIASPQATFALAEIPSGLTQGFGGAIRLSNIVGKARALEILLTGATVSAEDAMRIGLVNRVVNTPEELLPVCEGLAGQISRNAPLAIKYALESVNHGSNIPLADGLRLESALFGLCFATDDVQEGTRAFLEKRPPVFSGR
jgi:enoyl-CoA hydratase